MISVHCCFNAYTFQGFAPVLNVSILNMVYGHWDAAAEEVAACEAHTVIVYRSSQFYWCGFGGLATPAALKPKIAECDIEDSSNCQGCVKCLVGSLGQT